MSVITFWNNGKEQTGKTAAIAAIATYLSIEHNYKILIVTTGYKDETLTNCFWKTKKEKQNMGIFGPNTNVAMEDGVEALNKMMKSGKLSPEMTKNYTKIVFKDRLDILKGYVGSRGNYIEVQKNYPEIVDFANRFYDLILVDLDKEIETEIVDEILKNSDLIVASLNQRLSNLDAFIKIREEKNILKSKKSLILIGKYDKFSKYNIKNITRYLKEKNKVSTIPYNTLFFEACEESKVPDLFFRIRKIEQEDTNGYFLSEVKRTSENIIYRLHDLQMKM